MKLTKGKASVSVGSNQHLLLPVGSSKTHLASTGTDVSELKKNWILPFHAHQLQFDSVLAAVFLFYVLKIAFNHYHCIEWEHYYTRQCF